MTASSARLDKTDAALQRLENAVARLEWVLPGAQLPAPDLFGTDALAVARQDYVRLDQATRHVEDRIGLMVDRLQAILGE